MNVQYLLLIATSLFLSFSAFSATEAPGALSSRYVQREPFVPQTFDLGFGVGNAWSSSSYILLEGFAGLRVFNCGYHCFAYVDASMKVAAQRGQTHYIGTGGLRFQTFAEGSSLGPYVRPFAGTNHYIFSGTVQDFGVIGVALGTFFFLHPAADLRAELSVSGGPIFWTVLSLGAVVKWRNL